MWGDMSYATIISAAQRDTRRYCAIELGMTSAESVLTHLFASAKPDEPISASFIAEARKVALRLRRLEAKWRKGKV